jgi:hypothetical protein
MNRPGLNPANIRRQSTLRKKARWWLEHTLAVAIILGISFGVGTLQAHFEGHTPHIERTTP